MKKPQTLNARGLIAAAVAVASGSALAEQAGRVSFVTGDVRATASDIRFSNTRAKTCAMCR